MKQTERFNKPECLDVMTWAGKWGDSLEKTVSARFTELTGVPVRHHTNIGLRLPEPLHDALRTRQRPPYDVVWSNAVPAVAMAESGCCQLFDEDDMPSLAELYQRARPAGFADRLVFPYSVHYVLVYLKSAVEAGALKSWNVLMDKKHAGKIAIYPNGKGFYPIAQVLGGGNMEGIPENMQPCWDYLAEFRPRIAVLDYSIGMESLFRTGRINLCFRALPNAVGFIEAGLDVGWTVPVEGTSDTTDALWIPQHVPEERTYWARQYIDIALSASVQAEWCNRLGVLPANRKAAASAIFDRPGFPRNMDDTAGFLYVPDHVIWRHEARWETIFEQLPSAGR
ncbi:extracellular solute-binding protein [Methylobacter luteus]|uniref:extracellular solute-binding protein n=1 Tax=Methylobacter luteus TaxID=415 RepID=UPI0003F8E0FC|nr:extracellular solute-binding protein [Methylobacter luteus]